MVTILKETFPPMSLQTQAEYVADRLSPPRSGNVGDPIAIITGIITVVQTLLSIWSSCQSASGQTAKTLVASHITSGSEDNPSTVQFDPRAVRHQRLRVRRAHRANHEPVPPPARMDQITTESWRQVLMADEPTVAACCSEGVGNQMQDPGESDGE